MAKTADLLSGEPRPDEPAMKLKVLTRAAAPSLAAVGEPRRGREREGRAERFDGKHFEQERQHVGLSERDSSTTSSTKVRD